MHHEIYEVTFAPPYDLQSASICRLILDNAVRWWPMKPASRCDVLQSGQGASAHSPLQTVKKPRNLEVLGTHKMPAAMTVV